MRNSATKSYSVKEIRIDKLTENTENSSLKRSSCKARSIIRIKYRRLNTKSSNIK